MFHIINMIIQIKSMSLQYFITVIIQKEEKREENNTLLQYNNKIVQ